MNQIDVERVRNLVAPLNQVDRARMAAALLSDVDPEDGTVEAFFANLRGPMKSYVKENTVPLESYLIKDERGRYFEGCIERGQPVCTTDNRDEASEMTPEEINNDFPNGLPAGWTKETP